MAGAGYAGTLFWIDRSKDLVAIYMANIPGARFGEHRAISSGPCSRRRSSTERAGRVEAARGRLIHSTVCASGECTDWWLLPCVSSNRTKLPAGTCLVSPRQLQAYARRSGFPHNRMPP